MTEVLLSEWTKIRSVRSTMWTLLSTLILLLGFGALVSFVTTSSGNAQPLPGLEGAEQALLFSLAGLQFGAMAMAVLGIMVISGEYRTGMIRTSLLGVPKRMRLLAGKIVVFTGVSLVVSLVTVFLAFYLGQALLSGGGLDVSIGDPEVLRAVIGSGLFLTASGLFGLALGALVRHTPGAIVSYMVLTVVLPLIINVIPGDVGRTISMYLTTNAGLTVTSALRPEITLAPWQGFGV